MGDSLVYWSRKLVPGEECNFPEITQHEHISLHVSQVSLECDPSSNTPLNAVVYCCLLEEQDDEHENAANKKSSKKQKKPKVHKFVLAHLNTETGQTQHRLDQNFDADNVKLLSFEVKGNASVCLSGSYSLPNYDNEEDEDEDGFVDEEAVEGEEEVSSEDEDEENEQEGEDEEDKDEDNSMETEQPEQHTGIASSDNDGADSDSDSDEDEDAAPANKFKTKFAKAKENKRNVTIISDRHRIVDGVEIFDIVVGHGKKAKKGDKVSIRYKGKLDPEKNKCFDQSKREPFTWNLGSSQVIKGLNIAVEGMTLNSEREVIIPPHLGYGKKGSPPAIPPNATLYFDVKLVDLQENEAIKQKRQHELDKLYNKQKELRGINVKEEQERSKPFQPKKKKHVQKRNVDVGFTVVKREFKAPKRGGYKKPKFAAE